MEKIMFKSLKIIAGTGKKFMKDDYDNLLKNYSVYSLEEFVNACNHEGFSTELCLIALVDTDTKQVYR